MRLVSIHNFKVMQFVLLSPEDAEQSVLDLSTVDRDELIGRIRHHVLTNRIRVW